MRRSPSNKSPSNIAVTTHPAEFAMEDLKIMVKDCLGPLPRVCQEQVLLDMERSRMLAADSRDRLSQAIEALRNSENQRRECEEILRDAMTILDQHLANEQMSDSSRNELTSLYGFLWHATSIVEIGSENFAD